MQAIVLARRNVREYDQIISLYTKETGKRDVLARGVKKMTSKNAAHLEPFSCINAEIVPGREIDHLTKVISIDFFSPLRTSIEKSLAAGYIVQLIDRVTQVGEPDERLFDLLKSWLTFVEKKFEFKWVLVDAFVMNLFVRLGLTPIIDQCVICDKPFATIALEEIDGKNQNVVCRPGFFFAGGGLICGGCRKQKQDIGEEIHNAGLREISTMAVLLKTDWTLAYDYRLEQKEEQALRALVYKFAVYHTERKISDWEKIRARIS